jgi:hypothetical protein
MMPANFVSMPRSKLAYTSVFIGTCLYGARRQTAGLAGCDGGPWLAINARAPGESGRAGVIRSITISLGLSSPRVRRRCSTTPGWLSDAGGITGAKPSTLARLSTAGHLGLTQPPWRARKNGFVRWE